MEPVIHYVDAFVGLTEEGNPAAVCLLDEERDDAWMQARAKEIGLSETAFVKRDGHEGARSLRWFTPSCEVDLCGHATLAAAHILWQEGLLRPDEEAQFDTKSGPLVARARDEWIQMDFPREDAVPADAPDGLAEALGVDLSHVAKSRMDYLIVVENEQTLRNMLPKFDLLQGIASRGFIVTSESYAIAYDFVSRFFAPAAGINEDPATGSAHCTLGPFWAERLGKDTMKAYQASERGGIIRVHVTEHAVSLSGKARTKRTP